MVRSHRGPFTRSRSGLATSFCCLSFFLISPERAAATPNLGGALLVHTDDRVTYTTTQESYCGLSTLACDEGGPREPGAAVATSGRPIADVVTFWILAGFPPAADPRVTAVTFGLSYLPASLTPIAHGSCGDFELASASWPAPGEGTALTWNVPRRGHLFEAYWFGAYVYGTGSLELVPHPTQGAFFGDDRVPAGLVPIDLFGILGFGGAGGTNPHLPGSGSAESDLYFTSKQIDLGRVPVGGSKSSAIECTNLGNTSLEISGMSSTSEFLAFTWSPSPIQPGDSAPLGLHATPTTLGPFQAEVLVTSNDPDEPATLLLVTGETVDAPIAGVTPGGFELTLAVGSMTTDTLTITNLGASELEWSAQSSATWITTTPAEGLLGPGTSDAAQVDLFAQSLTPGHYTETILIQTNDPEAPEIEIPVVVWVFGEPKIAATPTPVEFGQAYVGATVIRLLRISNLGTLDLEVAGLSVDSPEFEFDGQGFTLESGAHRDLQISWTPAEVGERSAGLTITSDDPDQPLLFVPLRGVALASGRIEVDPVAISARLEAGEETIRSLSLANVGAGNLEWELRTVASTRGLSGYRILYDQTHGQQQWWTRSTLVQELRNAGAEVAASDDPITEGLLADRDLLWSISPTGVWQSSELEAIRAWVSGGGIIVLEGDAGRVGFNQILEPLEVGIEYVPEPGLAGFTDQIVPHPSTEGVVRLHLPGPSVTLRLTGSLPRVLFSDPQGKQIGALAFLGLGRVVVLSDDLFLQTEIYSGDNLRFGKQLFDWCASDLPWIVASPTEGQIAPGGTVDLSVVLDAEQLIEGAYAVDLAIESNDLAQPELRVPIELNVSGTPRIAIDPGVLDFGLMVVGETVARTLRLANDGTAPLVIDQIAVAPEVYTAPLEPFTLAMGARRSIDVSFSPTDEGEFPGAITFRTNDPAMAQGVIELRGEAEYTASAALAPSELRAELEVGQRGELALALSSLGDGPVRFNCNVLYGTGARVVEASPRFGSVATRGGTKRDEVDPLRSPGDAHSMQLPPLWISSAPMAGQSSLEDLVARLTELEATFPSYFPDRTGLRFSTWPETLGPGPEIEDGGSDSYDGGNRIATNLGGPVLYTEGEVRGDPAFGPAGRYFTMEAGGLFALVADLDGTEAFQIDGNLGADGDGVVEGLTVAFRYLGRDYVGFQKSVYGAGDAPVLHLILVEANDSLIHEFSTDTNNDFDRISGLTGAGRIYYLLADGYDADFPLAAERVLALAQLFLGVVEPVPMWLTIDPGSGRVPARGDGGELESATIRVLVDASVVDDGSHGAQILVATNDPENPTFAVPIVLTAHGVSDLAISSDSLEFGDLFVNGRSTRFLEVTNQGTASLELLTIKVEGDGFTCPTAPFALPPRASRSVELVASPLRLGRMSGSVQLYSNDPDLPIAEVGLGVTGVLAPAIEIGPSSLTSSLFTGEGELRSVSIRNRGGAPLTISDLSWWEGTAGLSPPLPGVVVLWDRSNGEGGSYGYDYTFVQQLRDRGAVVREHVSGDVSDAVLSGVDLVLEFGWSATISQWVPTEIAAMAGFLKRGGALLAIGDSSLGLQEILRRVDAGIDWGVRSGERGLTRVIEPHAITRGVSAIDLVSFGPPLELVPPAIPLVRSPGYREIHAAVSICGAGRVFVSGDRSFASETEAGEGQNLLLLSQAVTWLLAPSGFSSSGRDLVLAPDEMGQIDVTLDASVLGASESGVLNLIANDPLQPLVSVPINLEVIAAARMAVSQDPLSFAPTPLGATNVRRIEIANEGVLPLEVTATLVSAAFGIWPDQLSIPPLTSAWIEVRFAPSQVGATDADLLLLSNDPLLPEAELTLEGAGLNPPSLSSSPDSLDLSLRTGETATPQIRIENLGSGELRWRARVDAAFGPLRGLRVARHRVPSDWFYQPDYVGDDLLANGVVLSSLTAPLATIDLERFEVFWMNGHGADYSPEEWEKLRAWVETGGNLLVEGPGPGAGTAQFLSSLDLGLSYDPECYFSYGECVRAAHPIADSTALLLLQSQSAAGCLVLDGTSAEPIFHDAFGGVVAAAGTHGFGRVVVVTSRAFREDDAYWNHALARASLSWLGATAWLSAEQGSGTIAPQSTKAIELRLDATGREALEADATIVLAGNDPIQPERSIPVRFSVASSAYCVVTPATLEFEPILVGRSEVKTLAIRNNGVSPLFIDAFQELPGEIQVNLVPQTIIPGGEVTATVTCTPTIAGEIEAVLRIETRQPDPRVLEVPISALALVSPSASVMPESILATLPVGGAASAAVAISNHGGSDLHWFVQPNFVAGANRPLQDLTGTRVLYDRSHGQQAHAEVVAVATQLEARGAEFISSSAPLTPDLLSEFDVLWIVEGACDHCSPPPWTAAQLAVVSDWVRAGGGVLHSMSTNSWDRWNAWWQSLGVGLQLSSTGGYGEGRSGEIADHPAVVGVRDLTFTSGYRTVITEPPAVPLVEDEAGRTMISVSRFGAGRISVLPNGPLPRGVSSPADVRLLADRMFDWLAGRSWIELSARRGVTPVGGVTNLTVEVSAAQVYGEEYRDELIFATNDVVQPELHLPVTLAASGNARIETSLAEVEFGSVARGGSVVRAFSISNPGNASLHLTGSIESGPFSIVDLASVVRPGETTSVVLRFSPRSEGVQSGGLLLASNDADRPQTTVSLSGVAVPPPAISIVPDAITFTVEAGAVASTSVAVANDGPGELSWSADVIGIVSLRDDSADRGRDLSGLRILWTQSAGQAPPSVESALMEDLAARGADVSARGDRLSAELLAQYDLLWWCGGHDQFGVDEAAAVRHWLESGGALILDQRYADPTVGYGHNELLEELGSSARINTSSGYGGETRAIHVHPATRSVGTVEGYGVLAIQGLERSTMSLVENRSGGTLVAAMARGRGRLVISCEPLWIDSWIGRADHRRLANQLVDWAFGEVLSVEPRTGELGPGGSATLSLDLDLRGVTTQLSALALRFESNDPERLEILVPVTIDFSAGADIALHRDSVDFGRVPAGLVVSRRLEIANEGTAPLELAAASIDSPWFQVRGIPLTVAPGTRCGLWIDLLQDPIGPTGATLRIQSNDRDEGEVQVPVGAEIVSPPTLELDASPVAVELPGGQRASRAIRIANIGASDLRWSSEIVFESGARDDSTFGRDQAIPFADLTGVRILLDGSRGDRRVIPGFLSSALAARGAELDLSGPTLSLDLLRGYDVFVSSRANESYAPAEEQALAEWLRTGGGMLLSGPDESVWNRVLAAAGVATRFERLPDYMPIPYGADLTKVLRHPSTVGVHFIPLESDYSCLRPVTDSIRGLAQDIVGLNYFVAGEHEMGRLFLSAPHLPFNAEAEPELMALYQRAIDWLALGAWLRTTPTSGTVAPGDADTVRLEFDAGHKALGRSDAVFRVSTNDPRSLRHDVLVSLDVTASPRAETRSTSVQFEPTIVGDHSEYRLRIGNRGNRPLIVNDIMLDTPVFSLSNEVRLIGVGEERVIQVRFEPVTPGPQFATLTLNSNDPLTPLQIALEGEGLPAPVLVIPHATHVVNIAVGDVLTLELPIENHGLTPLEVSLRAEERSGEASDDQCPRRPPSVAIITAWDPAEELLAELAARPHLALPTSIHTSQRAPNLAELLQFDSVLLAFGDRIPHDRYRFGDALADYLEAGRGVVLTHDGFCSRPFEGRFSQWLPFDCTGPRSSFYSIHRLRAWDESHLLMDGIEALMVYNPFDAQSYSEEAEVIAWSDGNAPLVTARGDNLVVLNFSALDGVPNTGGALAAENALLWASHTARWIGVQDEQIHLPAGKGAIVRVVLDATELEVGDHPAVLCLRTNDPERPHAHILLDVRVGEPREGSGLTTDGTPGVLAFTSTSPNPFREICSLRFDLPTRAWVQLQIFDVTGRTVRRLVAGEMDSGRRAVTWNGRDDAGRSLPTGVYLARLSVGEFSLSRRVLLAR
ncbi:MAG: choice-of-anchor D domain-containing protein [Candidatus Eisenbacteria bacterium]|nr:choice-of-anchor D domain-containing protein [Candidatus Eisenbacteria bacterium]